MNATGSARLGPDNVTIHFKVKGTAESPKGALDKFRAKRIVFDKMAAGYPEVEFESEGIEFGKPGQSRNQVFMNGQQPAATFEARENIYAKVSLPARDDEEAEEGAPVKVSSPEGIAALIEAAIEIDATLGEDTSQVYYNPTINNRNAPTGPVLYGASDEAITAARSEAIKDAMDDARRQALELAEASGRSLGPVQNVTVSKPFHGAALGRGAAKRTVQLTVSFAFDE